MGNVNNINDIDDGIKSKETYTYNNIINLSPNFYIDIYYLASTRFTIIINNSMNINYYKKENNNKYYNDISSSVFEENFESYKEMGFIDSISLSLNYQLNYNLTIALGMGIRYSYSKYWDYYLANDDFNTIIFPTRDEYYNFITKPSHNFSWDISIDASYRLF